MIEVRDVTKSLGGRRIVDGVSFDVRGTVALLGRNGAGKTTLMRMLCGILAPDAGTIAIAGHPLAGDAIDAKRLLGFQPEFPDLHPDLRGRDFLDFVAAARDVSPHAMERAVARYDAASLLDVRAGALSQGQRRTITLVAATMHAPEVLLLDEPTNALDVHRIAALRTWLASAEAPKTVLVSTHQLDFVATIASRYLLIREGRIVGEGEMKDARRLEALVVRET